MHGILRKERSVNIASVIENGAALAATEAAFLSDLYKERIFPLPSPQYPLVVFVDKDLNSTKYEPIATRIEELETIQKVISRYETDRKWESPSSEYKSQTQYQRLQKGHSPKPTRVPNKHRGSFK